jgi:citrate synthase
MKCRQFSPPMPMVMAGLAAYLGAEPTMIPSHMGGNLYHGNLALVDSAIVQALARFAVVAGLAASHRLNKPFKSADPNGTYLSNLLLMMGHVDPETGIPDPKKLSCLQRFGALGADHELTNSTFALLVTSSSLADPLSCVISALASAYGPLHFGAPEAAYKVISEIGKPENVPTLIESVKRGEKRLFGYGHRMYKTVDPRIRLIKGLLDELEAEKNPLLRVAAEIDRIASTDKYFTERKLNANADLYGVFFYIALYDSFVSIARFFAQVLNTTDGGNV